MGPTVSCIMIFFNAERFIAESIQSVFDQTFSDWELLLIDDGSSDGSSAIAREIAAAHPEKVRYFEHDRHMNQGMSASRNVGMDASRGQYIAFLDSDDVWRPCYLDAQVSVLKSNPEVGMVCGRSEYWFSWMETPETEQRDFVPDWREQRTGIVDPPDLLLDIVLESTPAATCAVMFRREAFAGVRFEPSFRGLFEDQAFLAKAYLSQRVCRSDRCLARYRMHADSCVFVELKSGRYREARLAFLDWLERCVERGGSGDAAVLRALRAERSRLQGSALVGVREHARRLLGRLGGIWRGVFVKLVNLALRGREGSLEACPNPVVLRDPFAQRFLVGQTTLIWHSRGTERVEVRVGSPKGPLLCESAGNGSRMTGQWVSDGMEFYLQDAGPGKAQRLRNTLAIARVIVRGEEELLT